MCATKYYIYLLTSIIQLKGFCESRCINTNYGEMQLTLKDLVPHYNFLSHMFWFLTMTLTIQIWCKYLVMEVLNLKFMDFQT